MNVPAAPTEDFKVINFYDRSISKTKMFLDDL